MKASAELAALFGGLGVVPLGPLLVATYLGFVWQVVTLAGVWTACWYVWLWARMRREEK